MWGKSALKYCKLCAKINKKYAKIIKKYVTFCCVLYLYSYFSLIKIINNCILRCVTVCLLCSINVTIYLLAYFTTMNGELELQIRYVELFYKKYAEKSKKMRSHCGKCKKCACTASNAKKCGTCGKTQKVQDFCAAHNRIFPQGVNGLFITY